MSSTSAMTALRSSDYATTLRSLLSLYFGVTNETYEREKQNKLSDSEVAKLSVIRNIFMNTPSGTLTELEVNKALLWLRRQKLGRLVQAEIAANIDELRYIYESKVADEFIRLLLLATKGVNDIFYVKDLGEVACLLKA